MKKIYFSCALILISYFSHAQISKGAILLGGNVQFITGSSTATSGGTPVGGKPSATSFYIYPSIGWAVKDNLVLGIEPGIGYTNSNGGTGGYISKENDYSLGIFLRKYKPLGNRFYFFLESMLSGAYQLPTYDAPGSSVIHQDGKLLDVNLGLSPGVAYSLSRKWQLEVEFPNVVHAEYSYSKTNQVYPTTPGNPPAGTTTSSSKSNNFNLGTNLTTNFQLQVGLKYLIGG